MNKTLLAALSLGFAALNACAPIAPGDYALYRIAAAETEPGDDCFGENGQDVNEAEDTTTFLGAQTFAIFRAADVYYLEFGDIVMTGQKDGDLFTFSGENVDVNYFNQQSTQITATDTFDISFTLNGKTVIGTVDSVSEQACSGPDCTENESYSCSSSGDFWGSRIDGVELSHSVDFDN